MTFGEVSSMLICGGARSFEACNFHGTWRLDVGRDSAWSVLGVTGMESDVLGIESNYQAC